MFLSYTSELADYPTGRSFVRAAEEAVTQTSYVIVDMEHFTADGEPPAAYCQRKVRGCDVYVGLIGLRYGSRVRDQPEISYTELEFETATEAGLLRLVFFLDEQAERLSIPPARLYDHEEQDPDGRRRQGQFRTRLRNAGVTTDTFSTPDQLELKLFQALHESRLPGPVQATDMTRLPARRYLVGRDAEVGSLVAAWLMTPPEPVALLGAPGIGKSAVCLAALHDDRVRERFGSRRWFVRCDGTASAKALLSLLGITLRVIAEGPADALADRVCAALGEGLGVLVLDNFETPWHADLLPVEELLGMVGSIPGVGVAVSARGTAHPAVLRWRDFATVKSLPLSDARQLFLAVAGATFASDPDLDGLLSELDGMPLAVELLGYAAQGEPDLGGLARRWQQERLGLLERMSGGRPELSVATSVEASVTSPLMTDSARRLFGLLGVLPDGAAGGDLDALLPGEGLAAASTLRKLGLVFDEAGRVRMLAPVREHAAARHPPETEDLNCAINHYAALAAAIEDQGNREKGAQVAARLEAESGNVTEMLERAAVSAQIDELVNGLCGLAQYWTLTGATQPDLLTVAEEAVKAHGDLRQRARTHRAIGDLARACSDLDIAQARYQRALPMFRNEGDALGAANCIKGIGDVELARSDHEAALAWYQEALPLYQRSGSVLGEANCIKSVGDIALECSAHEVAKARYEEALSLYQEAESVLGEANCIKSLGDVELARFDYQAAWARYKKALSLYQQVRSLLGEANCIQCLGDVELARSDHEAALARYEEALPLYRRVRGVLGEANCIKGLGDIAVARSDYGGARSRYSQALLLYEDIEELCSVGWTHVCLARLETLGSARTRHWDAARQAWAAIGREDLIESVATEFQ